MNLDSEIKMIHKDELFKLVASELDTPDPTWEELEEILKNNEIKVEDVSTRQGK